MESPGEIKFHQRREMGKEGKVGMWKMDFPDKIQGELIKKCGKRTSL
jgi:hypothetical protein